MDGPARRTRFLPLALAFLSTGLGAAMATPFLALFLDRTIRTTPGQTTVYLAAAPLAAVAVSTLLGRLSDRLPTRRGVLTFAGLAGSAGWAVTAMVRDYVVLLLATVTLTAAAAATMPQLFAYSREALGDSGRVALGMSSLRATFSAAWVAGPPLSAALVHLGGFRAAFGATSVMYAVTALIAFVGLRQPRVVPTDQPDEVDGSERPDASRTTLWLTVGSVVLITAATVLAVQGLPLFLTHDLGAGVDAAGWILGLCAGLEIPIMLALGALSTRIPITRLLVAGAAVGVLYRLLVVISTAVWLPAVGQLLNAATISAFAGLAVVHLQNLLPRHTGRASTLYSNSYPAGTALAAPVIGLSQSLGYRMPFVVGAGMCALAIVLLLLARPPEPAARDAVQDAVR